MSEAGADGIGHTTEEFAAYTVYMPSSNPLRIVS